MLVFRAIIVAGEVGEKVVGIQGLVAQELVAGAVDGVRARFHDQVNDAR